MPNCSSACCSSCSMRSAAWALATSSRCRESVSAVILALSSLTSCAHRGRAPRRDGCARRPGRRAGATGHRDRGGQPRGDQPARLRDRRRHRGGVLPRHPRPLRAQPRLAFGRGRAAQRIRPSANGIRAFLRGAHRQPRLDLGGPRGLGGRHRLLTVDRLGVERSAPAARCAAASSSAVSSSTVFIRPASSSSRWPIESLPLVFGGAGLLAEPAELLVDRRDRGVGLVERGERLLGGVLARRLLGQRARQRRGQLRDLPLGSLQFRARLLDLGGDLQRARLAVGSAGDPARRRPGRRRR